MSTQTNKNSKKLWLLFFAVAVIVACVLLIVFLPRKTSPYAVMELDVNPEVQFVLDTNNKVMHVNYINDDAETLLSDEDLEGLDVKKATEKFVNLCVEAGFLDVNTTKGRVNVTIYCENLDKLDELSSHLKDTINSYFDENGIIAGAVMNIKTTFEEAYNNIAQNAQNFADMTQQEILSLIDETSNDLKDISITLRTELFDFINELKENPLFQDMPSLEETIDNLKAELENSKLLTDEQKAQINKQIDEIQNNLDELLKQFREKLEEKLEELRTLSKEFFENAKQLLNEKIEQTKQLIEQHKQYFEQNREEVLAKIEEHRATLN